MFNLLMHYSKENKALYDQQKAAKKAKNDAQKQAQANQNVNGNASKINGNYGYKIPNVNQNSGNGSFAIPGQPASSSPQRLNSRINLQQDRKHSLHRFRLSLLYSSRYKISRTISRFSRFKMFNKFRLFSRYNHRGSL